MVILYQDYYTGSVLQKQGNSYRIMASCGYDVDGTQEKQRMTWKPEPGMTPKQIEKELNQQWRD